MTVAEAAGIIGITPRAVAKAIQAGRIPARKLPGRTGAYLLDPAEVHAFAATRNRASV